MVDNVTPALHALASAIFQDDRSGLTAEHLQSLLLPHWPAYWPGMPVPDSGKRALAAQTRTVSLLDMRFRAALDEVSGLFQAAHVRFAPIKGADLAWRVYPASGMRRMGDLDILAAKEDLTKALNVLRESGWKARYEYDNEHHLPLMEKNSVALELHFLMPHIAEIPGDGLWQELKPVDGTRYQLPLELNLVMLFQHTRMHCWLKGIQLLLDCAFLVKAEGYPDWNKVSELSALFKVPSPAPLFQAFPDFFPAAVLPEGNLPDDVCRTLRRLILANHQKYQNAVERTMMAENRFSRQWWQMRLRGMSPAAIRQETANPRGHYGKLLLGYFRIGTEKLRLFWRYRHGIGDSEVLARLNDEKSVDAYLRRSQEDADAKLPEK